MMPLRLLADQDIFGPLVRALRAYGHDVVWIDEYAPGITDRAVLALAVAEQRILLITDKDHGELLFKEQLPPPPGVVFFHYVPPTPQEPAHRLQQLLIDGLEIIGFYTTISESKVRQRPLG